MFRLLERTSRVSGAVWLAGAASLALIIMTESFVRALTEEHDAMLASLTAPPSIAERASLLTPFDNDALPQLDLAFDKGRVILRAGAQLKMDDFFLESLPIVGWGSVE